MGVRRVLFKDWCYETNADSPSRWDDVTGTFAIQSNRIQFDNTAGAGNNVAPAEQGVQLGSITQNCKLYFDVVMRPDTFGEDGWMGFVMFANAAAGPYLGDSYVLLITSATTALYRSDNDALTELVSVAAAHSEDTEYTFIVLYDPVSGDWDVWEDTVLTLEVNDSTYTTGSYIGCTANKMKCQWTKVRVREPDMTALYNVKYANALSKQIAEAEIEYFRTAAGGGGANWACGDGIEIELYDGTNRFIDFWGKVERMEKSMTGPQTLICRDWRVELQNAEFVWSGTEIISDIAKAGIASMCRVLSNGNVKASGDVAAARTINADQGYTTFRRLLEEVSYFTTYDGDGKFTVSDTYNASGLAIADTDVLLFEIVQEITDQVNTVRAYYAGGNTQTGGSGSDYNTYGKSERIIVDTACPNITQAQARAGFLTTNFTGAPKILDVWVGNQALSGLKPGDTGTITNEWLSMAAWSFLVLEKEYNLPNGTPGIRYRLSVASAGTPLRRDIYNGLDKFAAASMNARWALGQQV